MVRALDTAMFIKDFRLQSTSTYFLTIFLTVQRENIVTHLNMTEWPVLGCVNRIHLKIVYLVGLGF